ncbi:hypothetical protein [Methylotenera sp.]|uniref:hypothetical protein n=1 Tax=Methylotenera sp. TaxID=2051956 RepID=UPI00248A2BD7|nr:hypothetical protein [Methylotenera sp.]MDI1361525.1 hypothetical protein [Methylotenera sp.]
MKSIFNFIFSKNTKSTFQNSSFQNSSFHNAAHISQASKISKNEPQLSIFDNAPINDGCYQVAEISFDEFKSSTVRVERRKFPRKPGETRSAYSTKQ